MKPKSMLLLFVAAACGLIAAIFTAQHLAGNQPAPPAVPTDEKKSVVIAVVEIPAGTQIKEDMLKVVELPTQDYLPEGTFAATAEITGQVVRFPVFKGEPILAGKLGRSFSIADALAPGMKAYTVKVADEDKAMTGLIDPKDHVDVHWLQMQPDLQSTSVRLLLQNVKVLAVGQRTESDESESGASKDSRGHTTDNYTLEVTPRQHQRLQAALVRGKVRLALRGKGDTSVEDLDERELDTLLGFDRPVEKPVVVAEPVPEPEQYEVIYVKGNETIKETWNIVEERNVKSRNPKPN
jgi:pilus assembly protein CpaB